MPDIRHTSTPRTAAPRISLVLSAGGARGYAHIGVIEELLAQGYEIGAIAGSSMGALIGGIHAAGKLAEYRDFVTPLQRFDVWKLLDFTLSGGGFIKGDRIIEQMRSLVGDLAIEDLPIPFTAVAVDLDLQREVWFSRGPLFDAIRASISVPTLLRPFRHQGRLLVDGGLLNPLPVMPTLRDLTDATIAVDVNAPAERESGGTPVPAEDAARLAAESEALEPGYGQRLADFFGGLIESHGESRPAEPGAFELLSRSYEVMQETITRLKIAAQPPDLLITVPRNASMFYDFHRANELIAIGRRRTREALERWTGPRPAALRDGNAPPQPGRGKRRLLLRGS